MSELCPCGSGVDYSDCCGKLHSGEATAKTAEQLMRSRYSAFVKHQRDYLLASWHESTRPDRLSLDDSPQWVRLEIVACRQGLARDKEGWVDFKASCLINDKPEQMRENSRFVKEGGRWFYVAGELKPVEQEKIGRNAPCPCGSGKKYKRCCGQNI